MEADLITAVLAGDRTLEMRLFGLKEIDEVQESRLTASLCRLMTRNQRTWKRYGIFDLSDQFTVCIFRLDEIYTGDWSKFGGLTGLQRVLRSYSMQLFVIDRTMERYMDVYFVEK